MKRWKEAFHHEQLDRADLLFDELGKIERSGRRGIPWVAEFTQMSGQDHDRPATVRFVRVLGISFVTARLHGERRFHGLNDQVSLNVAKQILDKKPHRQNLRRH